MRKRLYSFSVPLIGSKRNPTKDPNYIKQAVAFSQKAHVKPERQLGGPYISDKASLGQCVKLCDDCVVRYEDKRGSHWWSREGYRPNWGYYFTSECDGCSQRYMLVTLFVQDRSFYKVLAPHHGRALGPRRKLFRFPWRKQ